MPYYFYVFQSLKDDFLYKGCAENIDNRVAQHTSGKTKSLKHRLPLKLVYFEEFSTREEALAREKWSKTLYGGMAIRKLINDKCK